MEKIQAAIAKARAEREAREAGKLPPETARPAMPEPAAASGPSSRVLTPHPSAQEDIPQHNVPDISPNIEAAWQELASFSPKSRHMTRQRIAAFEGGKQSGPMDMLRTKVIKKMRENGWRRLAITSPKPKCGKSTMALNLAFSLARQTDLRTIVCDMDLRRPSLAGMLGLKGQRNFVRVLNGESTFREEAVRARSNLAFGVTETRIRHSAELLQGPQIGPALGKLTHDYDPDLMIFDMPAMFASDDTMAFLGHVDCVLLLAAAGKTTLREVDICEADLDKQTNVLGVVLNKCRYMDKTYA